MNKISYIKNRKQIPLMFKIAGGLLLALALSGCAHIFSKETLKEVDKGLNFEELIKDPEKYNGKTVLLGGVIVKTENKKDGTLLELYQTGLNGYGEPVNIDLSGGRFLAMDSRFLDSEIYRSGRKVTVAGVVNGAEVIKLGDIDYRCPYIVVKDIHLWKEELPERYGPHYPYYGEPFWGYPWYPWYYPYWPYTWYNKNMYYKQNTSEKLLKNKGYTTEKDNAKE